MNDDVIEGEYSVGTDAREVLNDAAERSASPTALAIRPDEPIRALVSPDEARKQWDDYQALKAAIADPDDFQPIVDKKSGKTKRFPKKSFVKKIQTYFGVTVRIRENHRDDLGDGHFGFRVVATAVAPNGREVEATGACSTFEDRFDVQPYGDEEESRYQVRRRKANARSYHDVLSTAETRATNRAVMNLIGGGEVTAEEADKTGHSRRSEAPPQARAVAPTPLDRERTKKRLFAKINEYATLSAEGERLKNDDERHKVLQQMYDVASFNDMTDEQLTDFERKLDLRIAQARQ